MQVSGYDYIIVGGGRQAVSLRRLSEMPKQCLLIEAGQGTRTPSSICPWALQDDRRPPSPGATRRHPSAMPRPVAVYPQGRVLGGGSRSMRKFTPAAARGLRQLGQ